MLKSKKTGKITYKLQTLLILIRLITMIMPDKRFLKY